MIRQHTIYQKASNIPITLDLWEQTEYIVDFGEGWTQYDEQQVLQDYRTILQPLHGSLYQLNYVNFVGITRFCGMTYRVLSRKLSAENIEQMHRLICSKVATLPYHPHTPTQTSWTENAQTETQPLHQWYGLRIALLENWEGASLREWWQLINRDPHHCLMDSKIRRPIGLATSVGMETVTGIITHPESWIELPEHHALQQSAVAKTLAIGSKRYMPSEVYDQEMNISYDTTENRLIKRIVQETYALTDWMDNRLRSDRHFYNRTELELQNIQMVACLNELLASNWLEETGELQTLPQASTVLQRKAGYRQWYSFYQHWLLGGSYPFAEEEIRILVDTKELSRIYEYWCYFMIIEIVEELTGVSPSVFERNVEKNQLERLVNGLCVKFDLPEELLSIYYNRCFTAGKESYSQTYKPDISLYIQGVWHHFDAKLKMDTDSNQIKSVKKEDLDKMHTYRDAIQNTESVWVLYPDDQDSRLFYQDPRSLNSVGGIGAVSVTPSNTRSLKYVISELIPIGKPSI